MDIVAAMEAYHHVKNQDLKPFVNTFYQLIALVAGLGEQGVLSYRN